METKNQNLNEKLKARFEKLEAEKKELIDYLRSLKGMENVEIQTNVKLDEIQTES